MAADNRKLANFTLQDIPPAPRGVPQVEVTFDIDANGILAVSAKDMGTGKEQKVTIEAATKMDESDIDRMVKEAEANKEADKHKREAVENRNVLDSLVFTTEKSLSEAGDKVPEDVKSEVEAALADAKGKLDSGDAEALKLSKEKLEAVSHKLAEALYKTEGQSHAGASASNQEEQGAASGKADPNVVDAEFDESSP